MSKLADEIKGCTFQPNLRETEYQNNHIETKYNQQKKPTSRKKIVTTGMYSDLISKKNSYLNQYLTT